MLDYQKLGLILVEQKSDVEIHTSMIPNSHVYKHDYKLIINNNYELQLMLSVILATQHTVKRLK